MSVEKAKEFLNEMKEKEFDEALKEKAAAAKTEEEKIALSACIAHEMGYDVTEADIREATEQVQQEDFVPLEDDMLDGVSGGGMASRVGQCPERPYGLNHRWEKTGNIKPGIIWDDVECKCAFCGATKWIWG